MEAPPVAAFDALAAHYDDEFTRSTLGGYLRDAVHRRLAARFAPGVRILEINCGTGVDAMFLARRGVRVLATDVSPGMLEVARARVNHAALADRIELRQLAIEEVDPTLGQFDGALSNFGGFNCVADPGDALRRLAGCVRAGGLVILNVMGPLVPWEWMWHLSRGRARVAFRRLRPDGVLWRGMVVRYPSVSSMRRLSSPWFRTLRVAAVGCFLPPSYAEAAMARHPMLMAQLARWERRVETWWPLPHVSDHYLIELQRREAV